MSSGIGAGDDGRDSSTLQYSLKHSLDWAEEGQDLLFYPTLPLSYPYPTLPLLLSSTYLIHTPQSLPQHYPTTYMLPFPALYIVPFILTANFIHPLASSSLYMYMYP